MPIQTKTVNFRFERTEKKFRLSPGQYKKLISLLNEKTDRDEYGETTVCNIYYDTPDYALIRRSVERPFFKEKLRLRSYGIPGETDNVFVEIKRKVDGTGYKRRIMLPFNRAKMLLRGEAVNSDNPQIEKEILELVKRMNPQPAVFLTYRRFAMTAKDDPGLRITIDTCLKFRTKDAEIPSENDMTDVFDEDFILMEIKSLGGIPLWLADEMSRLEIYQAPFSKIGTCYTRHIAPATKY